MRSSAFCAGLSKIIDFSFFRPGEGTWVLEPFFFSFESQTELQNQRLLLQVGTFFVHFWMVSDCVQVVVFVKVFSIPWGCGGQPAVGIFFGYPQ